MSQKVSVLFPKVQQAYTLSNILSHVSEVYLLLGLGSLGTYYPIFYVSNHIIYILGFVICNINFWNKNIY